MELSDILEPRAVKAVSNAASKKRLMQNLADTAGLVYGLNLNDALDALQARESLGPTGVGHGVAIPHARIEGLESVVGVFCKLEKPMEYDSVDRQPVDLVFALFAPVNSGVDHLKALALVSRLLRSPSVQAKLRSNDDVNTLYAVLTEAASSKAA